MAVDIWMVTQLLLTFYTIKCRIELEVANQRYEAFPPPLPSPLFPIGKWDTYLRGEEGKAIFCQRKILLHKKMASFKKKNAREMHFSEGSSPYHGSYTCAVTHTPAVD